MKSGLVVLIGAWRTPGFGNLLVQVFPIQTGIQGNQTIEMVTKIVWLSTQFIKDSMENGLTSTAMTFYFIFIVLTVWIGGSDWSVENTWVWEPTGKNISYTNWYPGQPNNSDGNENCLVLTAVYKGQYGKWFDAHCDDLLYYICEKG
ncbi:hypothetical protein KUTeg_013939 [Tegillarca granosa]|uniref:C-type lectin domain-containing protein n=1 Tax=Tegillarca granosa TaxID=220873 RepID=A0ABQ9EV58_TEGGR|nr:hypothetical protein KUTeg_013939 [Tegillarca granosa]